MRVAVVCPYAFDAHGGVQDQVAQIVAWLRADGHEAWAVAPGTGGPEGTRHVGGFTSLPANRSRAPISLNPVVGRRVRQAVEDADVVHIHEPFMPAVSLGAVLVDTPPKVGTFHADPGRIARGMYRGTRPLVRRLLRRLAVVTAVSGVAASVLGNARFRIVPNGIDLEPYAAEIDSVAGRVLFIGRDEIRKGLSILLEAWSTITREVPDASLHVIGAARDDSVVRTEFLGRVSAEVKVRELGEAAVLAAPNLGGESFGIVVLEGLAAGAAVVASDLAAFRSVAADAAVYVPVGDPTALANAIVGVLTDGERRAALATAARHRARTFGRDAVLRGYLESYETALIDS